ncbi:MAG: aminopeptidase P family protein [Oscillospiraceae bacterium]|nr:aminopeptidase P family protein [Oscillospiraceae bacterium]
MNNIKKIQALCGELNTDAILVTSEVNRYYATGFDSTDGMLLVTADKAWFMTDSRYTEAAENNITGAEVLKVAGKTTYFTLLNDIISRENISAVGFENEALTYSEYMRLTNAVKALFRPTDNKMTLIRASKTPEELEYLIKSQRIAEKAFNEIIPLVSTDITEKQLAAELMCAFYRNGADDKSFDPIVVSAEHSSMPHGVPSDSKIKEGFLTIDFGVKLNGWCSDTTRTLCVGKPTDEMRRVYDTVLSAQLAGIEAARAGVTGAEVDGAARAVIEKAGYGEYFGHSFGHSLGLEIHEAPNASPLNSSPLPAGAVISAEPGIYLPGKFGVRIEDVLFLTPDGNKNITNLSKELIIL